VTFAMRDGSTCCDVKHNFMSKIDFRSQMPAVLWTHPMISTCLKEASKILKLHDFVNMSLVVCQLLAPQDISVKCS
jgi:hypothetical protein